MIVTQCAEGVVMTNGMWCRDCPMFVPLSFNKKEFFPSHKIFVLFPTPTTHTPGKVSDLCQ